MENVILVNDKDEPMGSMEKLEVHQKGLLHRAFSVMVFNSNKELLLQQRAFTKYHSPGLWTNTCCSHPRPGEDTKEAAQRRLYEEMGIHCELHKKFDFIYCTHFENGLVEHEFDHVFIGTSDADPVVNKTEVADWKWCTIDNIKNKIEQQPEEYSAWFKILMAEY